MIVPVSTPSINLRAELRLALLAAAESCWLYAIVLTLATLSGFPRVVSPFGIFVVYLTGLFVGRLLPRSKRAWRLLQGLTIVFALLAILVAMRVGFYTDVPLYDFTWVSNYFSNLVTLFERVTAQEISTLILIAAFVRAMGFAQRPLTLWVVGFQFRLGIVIFFATALLAAFTVPVNFIFWVFAYFAFSLASISLARIEEAGQERPLGGKWALVMGATIAATMLLGFAATQFLTLDAVNAFFGFLSPLTSVLLILATIIAIPFFYLLEFLFGLLAPVFERLLRALSNIIPNIDLANAETNQVLDNVTRQLETFVPYLRLLGILAVALLIGWLIARALNRRMKWREEEMYAREALDERDGVLLEKRQPPKTHRARRREIHAENVRRIYAALLAHAQALGLQRREAETPFEFLPRLVSKFPDAAADLEKITRAYVAVHYAQQNATDAQVRELRAVWQRTKERMKDDALKYNASGRRK